MAKETIPVSLTPALASVFSQWAYAQKTLAYWKDEEDRLRDVITNDLLPAPDNELEGTHNYKVSFVQSIDGIDTPVVCEVKVTRKLTRTVDKKHKPSGATLPYFSKVTSWKFDLAAYKDDANDEIKNVITEKPAKASVSIGS